MKTAIIAIVCFASGLALQDKPETLDYEFDPPAFPADAEGTVFMHFLPGTQNFAANVNCMIQAFDGTLDEYDQISKQQFAAMGMKVVDAKKQGSFLTYEYTGIQQGRELHWYSEARLINGKVYLVTATALQSEWKEQSETLIDSVKSFKLKQAKDGAAG